MTDAPDLDAAEAQFLCSAFLAANGEPGMQVDMYVVGESEGLDRAVSRQMADNLANCGSRENLDPVRRLLG